MQYDDYLMDTPKSPNTATTVALINITLKPSTTQRNTDFTSNSFLDHGYVEWYWVALGLIVPVLLGTLFCVLDHMRRKKKHSSKHNEERLESMCERNKYVPPSYEEIIPNNQVIIESVPEFSFANHEQQSSHIPVFTIETELPVNNAMPQSHHAANNGLISANQAVTDNCSAISVDSTTNLTSQAAVSTISQSNISDYDDTSVFEDVDLVDTANVVLPPSYDDYHKYELFGSRAELV